MILIEIRGQLYYLWKDYWWNGSQILRALIEIGREGNSHKANRDW